MEDLNNKWALVTGASSGMGREFASALAEQGANLVLVARRSDLLKQLADELQSKYSVKVKVEAIDLSRDDSAGDLKSRLDESAIGVDVLINNAGYGLFGNFVEQPMTKTAEMLKLNVLRVTELAHVFAQSMSERRGGHILFVASLTAFQASPLYAAYAASKAYVLLFGEALHVELAPRNVHVTVLSPGLMNTGFLGAAGQRPNASMRKMMMEPRSVVNVGLDALWRHKPSVVAGGINKLVALSTRILPRSTQARLSYNMVKHEGSAVA